MPRSSRPRTERIRTEALLVRSSPFGEADAMVTFFTEQRGIISAVARSARRSARRFPALEPMHLLRIGLEERPGGDGGTLVESALARPRLVLVANLERLDAAGRALRWVRRAAPPHTPEPALWSEVNTLLDRLDAPGPDTSSPGALVAGMGLRLLAAVGWGLDLAGCVRCGKPCEPGGSAYLDPGEGGLVCRACGGARMLLRGEPRARLLAASLGDEAALGPDEVRTALEIVDAALEAHTGVTPQGVR
jgi:DNA repair protein RecO (recombination protein O)